MIESARDHFIQGIEEPMAGLAHHSKFAAGIIIENDRELNVILEILLDGLNHSHASGQCHVDDVGTFLRVQAHAIAELQLDAENTDALDPWALFPGIPVLDGHFRRSGRRFASYRWGGAKPMASTAFITP
jgi:hypothetical protein